MAGSVFLIGGGWSAEAFPETWGRFVSAVDAAGGGQIVCVLQDEIGPTKHEGYRATLTQSGAGDVSLVLVSRIARYRRVI